MAEVVVTAQLRTQSLQEVPLSVTAVSGDTIQSRHIENFADLAKYTPGFTAGSNYGFIRNSSMRGISNNQFGFGDDPSIAMFVDGVYQGRGGTGSQVNALYDVDRVEIIKGPQATLFGRSSIGGAISTITNQPVMGKYTGDAFLGFGERARIVAQGAVNLPIGDTLAVRIAADSESNDGYIKNLNGGPDLAPLDVKAARLSVRYTGMPKLDVTLKAEVENRRQSGSIYQKVGLPDFTVDSTLKGRAAYSNFDIFDTVLKVKYKITADLQVTSATSWRRVGNEYVEDYDADSRVIGGPYAQNSKDQTFQQDVIFNYDHGPVSAVFGGSYFNETIDGAINNWVDGGAAFDGFAFTGAPSPGLLPNDYSQAFNEAGTLRGAFNGGSVFADVTYEVIPKLKITGGMRYNYDSKRYTQDIPNPASLPINAGKIFAGAYYNWGYYTSVPITGAKTWDNTSFRAAATYDLTRDITFYFSYNQGWKAGGIDSFKVSTTIPGFFQFFGQDAVAYGGKPSIYNPEHSDSYEGGVKGRFFDRKLGLNLSLYGYTYTDLQVSVPQGGSSIIANVGEAEGKGVELETRFVPDKHWDLFGNVSFNDTNINAFDVLPSQVGKPLNQAPKWNGAAGVTYTMPAPFAFGGDLALSADVSFRSRYRTDNSAVYGVKGYALADLRATYTDAGGRYDVSVFVDNLFDKFTWSRFSAATPFLFVQDERSVIGPPRTVGVDLRYHFR